MTAALPGLPSVSLGPISLQLGDVLAVALSTASAGRLLRCRRLTAPQLLMLVFAATALLSLFRGVGLFGVEVAVNQFRKVFLFTAVALFFTTVEATRPQVRDAIGRVWLVAGGALVLLVFIRWGALAGGRADPASLWGLLATETPTPFRVVDAGEALLLLQATLIALVGWRTRTASVPPWAAPLGLAVVVLLQHRTVWIALLLTVLTLALRDPRLRRGLVPMLVVSVFLGAILAVIVLDDAVGETSVGADLGSSATSVGTFQWRYEGWLSLLEDGGPEGPGELLFGAPFGTSWERRVPAGIVDVSPHNFWLEILLRQGLVGLMAIGGCVLLSLARLTHTPVRQDSGLLGGKVLFLLILSQLAYTITYFLLPAQGIILGLAFSVAASAAPARRTGTWAAGVFGGSVPTDARALGTSQSVMREQTSATTKG